MASSLFKNNTLDLTIGDYKKNILKFALPIFISFLFQQTYNLIDSLIVGQFVGKEALAAVSSSGNLIFLFTGFFLGTGMGAGVLISKYFGSGDLVHLRKSIHTDVAFGIICGLVLTFFGIAFSPLILRLMGTAPDVIDNSITYFSLYFSGCLSIVLFNIFNGILNAVGNSKLPLYFLILSSCLNVVLDLFFVVVLEAGVGGAAIATTISQFVSAFLCFLHLLKKENIYCINIKDIKIDKEMLVLIIKYGIPSGIQNSVIGLANVIIQSKINLFGSDAMAGCGSYSKIEGFAFVPVNAFNQAISTFVAQNLGAKEYGRAKKGATFGILVSVIMAETIGIIMYILAPHLIRIFSSETEVIDYGSRYMRITTLFYFLLSFTHAIASVCRGSGKAIIPMLIMLFVWCGIRITYISIILIFDYRIEAVAWAYPITWSISSVISLLYYLKSDWIHSFEKKKVLA